MGWSAYGFFPSISTPSSTELNGMLSALKAEEEEGGRRMGGIERKSYISIKDNNNNKFKL